MVFSSSYSLLLLKLSVWINYGLSISLLSFLAKKFIAWYRSTHDLVILTYAIAMGILSINFVFTIATVLYGLVAQLDNIYSNPNPVSVILNPNNIYNSISVASSILSFIFVWIASVFLLRYYARKIGTAKYWIIVCAPLFYFLTQFQLIFINLFVTILGDDPNLLGIIITLFFNMSKPIGGILFGIAFWIISRRIDKYAIKVYLMISAYGIILLFASNQAIHLITAPYPPFGLVTVSFIGLSSYMFLIGIYSVATSISRDSELRNFIQREATREFKLLEHIGSAQLQEDLVAKVMPLLQREALKIEQETGIEDSLTESEIKKYVNEVLEEVRNFKNEG